MTLWKWCRSTRGTRRESHHSPRTPRSPAHAQGRGLAALPGAGMRPASPGPLADRGGAGTERHALAPGAARVRLRAAGVHPAAGAGVPGDVFGPREDQGDAGAAAQLADGTVVDLRRETGR